MRLKKWSPLAVALVVSTAACSTDNGSGNPVVAAAPKNVIFFLGDGMGITTLTAARIYKVGEDGQLTIDTLPETGFVKTYSNDAQVTDSAPSMSAYMTGVKMNNDVISMSTNTKAFTTTGASVTPYVTSAGESTCPATGNGSAVPTVVELAKAAGLGTGVVTTARLTHATPAAAYAHTCHRDGEYNIAAQAVPGGAGYNTALGDGVDVLLGGTSYYWTPFPSPVSASKGRKDGRDLVAEMKAKGYTFANTRDQMLASTSGKLLGLFDQAGTQGHMSYELDRNPANEPSLSEMTAKAIDVLSKNTKGYVLVVEGGRIDHALHSTNAKRALVDTVAFDDAIRTAISKVDLANTLIVVTADHDHTMVMNGYNKRTGPTTPYSAGVLGLVRDIATGNTVLDIIGLGYTALGFGNGESRPVARTAIDDVTAAGNDYHQEAVVPMSAGGETHGGGDVLIAAIGKGAEAVAGVMENTAVFSILKSALGL